MAAGNDGGLVNEDNREPLYLIVEEPCPDNPSGSTQVFYAPNPQIEDEIGNLLYRYLVEGWAVRHEFDKGGVAWYFNYRSVVRVTTKPFAAGDTLRTHVHRRDEGGRNIAMRTGWGTPLPVVRIYEYDPHDLTHEVLLQEADVRPA